MRKSLICSPYAMLKTNAQALFYECQYSFSLTVLSCKNNYRSYYETCES